MAGHRPWKEIRGAADRDPERRRRAEAGAARRRASRLLTNSHLPNCAEPEPSHKPNWPRRWMCRNRKSHASNIRPNSTSRPSPATSKRWADTSNWYAVRPTRMTRQRQVPLPSVLTQHIPRQNAVVTALMRTVVNHVGPSQRHPPQPGNNGELFRLGLQNRRWDIRPMRSIRSFAVAGAHTPARQCRRCRARAPRMSTGRRR